MITITKLGSGIDPATFRADLLLKSHDEYPSGYQQITAAIYTKKDLQVLVLHARVASWLKILAERYGPHRITYQVMDVHSMLEKRLGITIPNDYTDQEIITSGLLELNIPAADQRDFNAYLLEVFFGSFMNKPGAIYRVGEILSAYESEQWKSALDRPIVKKAYTAWFRSQRGAMDASRQPAEFELLGWLEKSPDFYIQNLSAIKLLANYPKKLGESVFGNLYPRLLELGLDLHSVPIILSNTKVIDEIRVYLNSLVSTPSQESLEQLLAQVSGYLEIELDAFVTVLRSKAVEVIPQLVQRIQHRFRILRERSLTARLLDDLELLVAVPAPSEPEIDWDINQWLQWATTEYLPYRFWLENTNSLNDEIGELAGKYADWLFSHYNILRYNSPAMAWRAMHDLGEKIKQHTGPVLVIMIDNFNFKFYPTLQRCLQSVGFLEQHQQPCLSMLPSFTEVSKKCIIVGDYKPFSDLSGYAATVQGSWSKKLGKKVRYLANIIELRGITEHTEDVYILNYLPVDFTLHQPDSHTGISHGQIVREYLTSLASDIQSFARRLGAEHDLMLVITSDHGSTRIPRGTVNVIDHNLYRKHAEDEHHRFITISEDETTKLPDKVKYECYLFGAQEFDLPDNYLVARRLYRFLSTDDSIYIHGGLTPEETIVPLAVYAPMRVSPRQLAIKLIEPQKIIAGTRLDITFEYTNHNNYPFEHVELHIDDPNLEADPIQIPVIGKLERNQVKIKARCVHHADISETKMFVMVSFEFLGQFHEQIVEVPVLYDSLIKTKFDLDNF